MDPDQTPRPVGEDAESRQRELHELHEDLAAVTRVLLGLDASHDGDTAEDAQASDGDTAERRQEISAKRRRLLDELSFLDD